MGKAIRNVIILIAFIVMVGCDHPEKARKEIYSGVEQMMRYGNYQEAEKHFSLAIRYDKNNAEAYYNRGCCKANMQLYRDAIIDFEKAVEIKSDYADAYFNIGQLYFYMGDYDMMCYYYNMAKKYGRENIEDLMRSCQ